ncbi:MAG TPA: hypothetical protein VEI28_05930 [Thermodesulfovibrionales bacterium]|nr:hypothetical protein [Thermodesulfovibrionales bacterium]
MAIPLSLYMEKEAAVNIQAQSPHGIKSVIKVFQDGGYIAAMVLG